MIELFIFIMLLSATALCAAAETAFFSLNAGEIRLMEHRGEKHAKTLAQLRANPQKLLVTILLLNTAGSITIASYATVIATDFFGSIGAGIATGAVTLVTLIFAEIFPKSLAIARKRRVSRFLAPLFKMAVIALSPLTYFILKVEHWIMHFFGGPKKPVISEDEIRVAAELGLENGTIDKREQDMIERVFRFDDIAVSEVMTKLSHIDALDGEARIKEIAHYIGTIGYSRFPVYMGKMNNYVGYVHINDVMRALNSNQREQTLGTISLPLTRIDAHMKLEQAFMLMIRERSHLYLVHEHNDVEQIIGLVTLEDMIEEILGEIEDEGDRREVRTQKIAKAA